MAQAFLIIDMLNDFVCPGAPLEVPETRTILPALQKRLVAARAQESPIIYVCDAHAPEDSEFERMGWPPHAIAGTEGAAVIEGLAPLVGDDLVTKTTYSGFHQTRLLNLLQQRGIDELVLTGCVSNICILYTAADAVMQGFSVIVPRDSVASLDTASGEFAFQQMEQILGIELV